MNKYLLVSTLFVVLVLASLVVAHDDTTADVHLEDIDFGMAPDSPWYAFDLLAENFQVAFAGSPEEQAQLEAFFTLEHYAEMQAMIEAGDYDAAQEAADAVEDTLESMQDHIEEVSETVDTLTVEEVQQGDTTVQQLVDLEATALDLEEASDQVHQELLTHVEEGTVTEEQATDLFDPVHEDTVQVVMEVTEEQDEVAEVVAETSDVATLEVEFIAEVHEEEIGLHEEHQEAVALQEIQQLEAAITEVQQELETAVEAGTLTEEQEVVLDTLLDQSELRLQQCQDAYINGDYGESFGQFTASEHLLLNADRFLGAPEEDRQLLIVDPDWAFGIDTDPTTSLSQMRQEAAEENARLQGHYDELLEKFPDKLEEIERESERLKQVSEFAEKFEAEYSEERYAQLVAEVGEAKASGIFSQSFTDEFEHIYGERYVPPGFIGVIPPEELPPEWPDNILNAAPLGEVKVGFFEEHAYTDPATDYQYVFHEKEYTYTTPAGLTYTVPYPTGMHIDSGYVRGNEVHTYPVQTPEGKYTYTYTATGYEVVNPDGTTEAFAYPQGEYHIGDDRIVHEATGYEMHRNTGTIRYDYNPEFQTYISGEGYVYAPDDERLSSHAQYGQFDQASGNYDYRSPTGEVWTYDSASDIWKSSTGEEHKPMISVVAPVGHEERGEYTAMSGEQWTYDSSSGEWKSDSGQSYNPRSGEFMYGDGRVDSEHAFEHPDYGGFHQVYEGGVATGIYDSSGGFIPYDQSFPGSGGPGGPYTGAAYGGGYTGGGGYDATGHYVGGEYGGYDASGHYTGGESWTQNADGTWSQSSGTSGGTYGGTDASGHPYTGGAYTGPDTGIYSGGSTGTYSGETWTQDSSGTWTSSGGDTYSGSASSWTYNDGGVIYSGGSGDTGSYTGSYGSTSDGGTNSYSDSTSSSSTSTSSDSGGHTDSGGDSWTGHVVLDTSKYRRFRR